ncbi:MAG: Gfo/Idh/MocA family oxidoreductase [Ruminiclostridium sp.]|nr:Gfo/Idh/MocA family oxidoreductase [Ruminiclostridium sp.]
MDEKIRFGLAGCGRISGKHIEAISYLDQAAELVCVCDLIKERANLKALAYLNYLENAGIKPEVPKPAVYADLDEMLKKEEIDILSICTPSGLHPVHGIKAAQKHIHVLTEKPMATNLRLADDLIKACDEAKVKLFVVKQNRLNSTMQLLKSAVDKGRFGKIHMILVNVLWSRPQSYYDEAKWRGTWEFDGGAFCNQASHYADLVEWLGGPVESVTAMTGTLARRIETEDTGSAVIRFRNGAIGSMNVTMLAYPKNVEGSITIIGEKGTVRVGGVAINRIERWEFQEEDEDDKIAASLSYEPPNVYGFGHTGYYRNVLEVLKGNAEPDIDGREGRKSLELIMGIYKSSREGRAIQLPIDLY